MKRVTNILIATADRDKYFKAIEDAKNLFFDGHAALVCEDVLEIDNGQAYMFLLYDRPWDEWNLGKEETAPSCAYVDGSVLFNDEYADAVYKIVPSHDVRFIIEIDMKKIVGETLWT